MKKAILFVCSFLLVLGGCSSKVENKGKVLTIGVDDAIAKIEKQDSFIMLVTRSKCEYCELMLDMLSQSVGEHPTVIYNTVMDDRNVDNLNSDVKKLEKYVDRPDRTPHYYYIKAGKVVDADLGYSQNDSNRFWDWVVKNKIEDLT